MIDGRARDSRELVKMADFAVFCRGTTMSSTERRVNTVDFQIPVAIAGAFEHQVEVRPGDWIYGDLDGVIAIPPELVEPVAGGGRGGRGARGADPGRTSRPGMKVWDVYPKHRRL